MLKDTEITESAALVDVAESDLKGSRYQVRLIEGNKLGTTGYYPEEMLRRDGPKIFTAGIPMYIDHIDPEATKRGSFGSVHNLAGELVEDAHYVDGDGLYATIEVFEHQRPLIKSLKDKIGISIRARGRTTEQNIGGKLVPVFEELLLARSADFVVRAGAGGKIVSILESAQEDSESDSELEEEGIENMDEVLEAIKALRADFGSRLTNLEEAAKAPVEKEEESKEEAVVDYDAALEIAEAFVASTLDKDGRQRVLDLHRANKKPIAELIEAEEAYVKSHTVEATESEGHEESEEKEAAESAETPVPSFWAKKDK